MSALVRSRTVLKSASLLRTRCFHNAPYLFKDYPAHTIINMPALSPTMTQGNLAQWSKKIGDKLAPGDVLAEVETDKAQMDFEFQDDGYLAKILVDEGTKDVPVNKPIAVYVEDADDVAAFEDFTLSDTATTTPSTSTSTAETTQPKQESSKVESIINTAAPTATSSSGNRVIASPLAKTLALEHGVVLKNVKGTGPHGRITKKDIDTYLQTEQKRATSATATAAAAATTTSKGASAPASAVAAGGPAYDDIEITNMRRIIGERLLQSTQSIPSYIVSSDISVSKLLKLRKSLNATSTEKDAFKLSINDILIKAISVAAKRIPEANAYWLQDQNVIRQFKSVDVSVAVATPTGLLTPIVKSADAKGLASISKEVKDLVKRAKINKLAPEEFQGGTICISNMGMNHAVSMFTSIINPPQSTILAVGTTKRVPIEDTLTEKGFTFDDVITITGTFDHRTIDGAKAGEFMKELKTVIENPLQLLL